MLFMDRLPSLYAVVQLMFYIDTTFFTDCGRVRVVLPVKLIYSHLQVHNLALALG